MELIDYIIVACAAAGLVGLAFMGGYERGIANGVSAERELADRRVRGVLDTLNARPPSKAAKNRRKLAQKAVRK
jgi:hypothetical protein